MCRHRALPARPLGAPSPMSDDRRYLLCHQHCALYLLEDGKCVVGTVRRGVARGGRGDGGGGRGAAAGKVKAKGRPGPSGRRPLVPGAPEHRQARVLREARVRLVQQAQAERRAAPRLDALRVPAILAETRVHGRHGPRVSSAGERRPGCEVEGDGALAGPVGRRPRGRRPARTRAGAGRGSCPASSCPTRRPTSPVRDAPAGRSLTPSCRPRTCAPAGYGCGPNGDGCGGTLHCGDLHAARVLRRRRLQHVRRRHDPARRCAVCVPEDLRPAQVHDAARRPTAAAASSSAAPALPPICGGAGAPSSAARARPCTNLCLQQVAATAACHHHHAARLRRHPAPGRHSRPAPQRPRLRAQRGGAAVHAGRACSQCGATVRARRWWRRTAPDGKFTLPNVPVGTNIPLVIQLGRWRRQVIIPTSRPAATAASLRRPDPHAAQPGRGRHPAHGALHRRASTRSSACCGRWASTTPSSPPGRHRPRPPCTPATGPTAGAPCRGAAVRAAAALELYDQVLFPCEGCAVQDRRRPAEPRDYTNAGGRMFTTHYSYTWLDATRRSSRRRPARATRRRAGLDRADIDTSFPRARPSRRGSSSSEPLAGRRDD